MRIAYVAHLNHGRGSGVVAKIGGQIREWRRAGHEVRLLAITRDADVGWAAGLGDVQLFRYGSFPSRLAALSRLVRAVRRFRPDLAYLRWDVFYPPYLALPRRVPLVLEINTDDTTEYALGGRARSTYNRLTRGLVLGRAAGLVFVTHELAGRATFARAAGRRIVISNGIDLDRYPSLPAPDSGPPRLVFVGGGLAPWHGVDKVMTLAELRPGWEFDVIGAAGESGYADPAGQAATDPPNVHRLGRLEGDALLAALGRADVGIGSLALHRAGLDEASPLKAREYLAVGLPILYGHADPDADGLGGLVLRIPNTPTSIGDSLPAIDAFVTSARGRRIPRDRIQGIDTAEKERQRLAFFREVVEAGRGGAAVDDTPGPAAAP